ASPANMLFGFRGVLPLGDDIPRLSVPFVTVMLILANVGLWLIASVSAQRLDASMDALGLVPSNIATGQDLGTLFTHMFAHASVLHLAGNMFFLWIFGNHLEDAFGHLGYTCFYLLCGLVAGLAFVAVNVHSMVPCVGASGAIAGAMGAYMVLYPRSWMKTFIGTVVVELPAYLYPAFWFLMQLLLWRFSAKTGHGGIAWVCHISGFLFGAVAAIPAKRLACLRVNGDAGKPLGNVDS
ncbi:MAG: rhomboid family intramembrane serine protease, partial [Candidatus Hydrogenedentes bacterium]|nr:rhomboid family intramembrane serine protease [Candidatus Hydrogenedentota bacterium]